MFSATVGIACAVSDGVDRAPARLRVELGGVIGGAVDVQDQAVQLAEGAGGRALPVHAEAGPLRVGALLAIDVEVLGVEREAPAQRVRLAHEVVFVARQHIGQLRADISRTQALIGARVETRVGALAEALKVDLAGQQVGDAAAKLEVGQVGGGAGAIEVEAVAPFVVQRELALGENGALQRAIVLGGRAVDCHRAAVEDAAIGAVQRRAGFGGDLRRDGEIGLLVDHPVIRDRHERPEGARIANDRHQKAAGALHRRVGVGEIRHVQNRDAVEIEHGVVVLDAFVDRVLHHRAGPNVP